jgi:hypothetical protein
MVARIPIRRSQPRRENGCARHALPQPWEDGPAIREIKSPSDLTARFDAYLTRKSKNRSPPRNPSACPTATTSSSGKLAVTNIPYTSHPLAASLRSTAWAKARPNASASCGSLRQQASSPRGTFHATATARATRSSPPACAHESFSSHHRTWRNL